jgi:hypothetical protein
MCGWSVQVEREHLEPPVGRAQNTELLQVLKTVAAIRAKEETGGTEDDGT